MNEFFHSVKLDSTKCKGCINCIKRCPTEAIRVRNGKAQIINERCIDCGECIKICPHHAKLAIYDPLEVMQQYRYKIALPAPSLYGQFHNFDDVDLVLNGLIKMGFDEVFEVSKAAEIISDCTRRLISENKLKKPIISSACPAVVRLIRVRFPQLIDNILPLTAPCDLAASMAKKAAVKRTGFRNDEIGVIFISPCAAKNSAVKTPLGIQKSDIDHVVAISEIYPKLASCMKDVETTEPLTDSGIIGVGWAESGGEAAGSLVENYLAADGIENVIKVLEDLEDEKFTDLDFIELNACFGGCVGGVLTVENPYVAKARLKHLRKYLPVSVNHVDEALPAQVALTEPIESASIYTLSNNFSEALTKMNALEEIEKTLPGLDCGSCGAPSCRALAEDTIRGIASEGDCIFRLREHLGSLVHELSSLGQYIPPPFRTEQDDGDSDTSDGKSSAVPSAPNIQKGK